jgi:hypothetical protein
MLLGFLENSMIDPKIRRVLLRPLTGRKSHAVGADAYLKALARLDERALGGELVKHLRSTLASRRGKEKTKREDPETARNFIDLAKALYASRRISTQEYVIYAVNPVEEIHTARWLDGAYDTDLGPIDSALETIKAQHGLRPEQDWHRGEGPDDYVRLQAEYEVVLERKFLETLDEFGLVDLSSLRKENRKEFDRRRERGRRSVFHRDEFKHAVRDVAIRYENEARLAADVGAYSAAIICLGAGIEGLLLLRCLRSKKKTEQVARSLPSKIKPRSPDDPSSWRFETLIEVCLAAGWLPPIETPLARYNVAGLAHALRSMRNYVHPGRRAREQPWSEADQRDYQDANDIYVVLFSILAKISSRKEIPNAA